MRETTASTTIFKVMLAFTFLFSAFLSVAITYNRVYKLKNESISIIEKYEGISSKSLKIINNYLSNSGYNTLGNCEDGEYGVYDLLSDKYEEAIEGKKYYYCLSYYCKTDKCKIDDPKAPNGNSIFYKTKFFFKFNLPFFGELFTFKITGDSKEIKLYSENQKLK